MCYTYNILYGIRNESNPDSPTAEVKPDKPTKMPDKSSCNPVITQLGDLYKIVSAESILQGGSCQFMEINTVELNSDPTVVSFDLVIDGIVIAHISLFPEEAVRKTEVALEPSHGDRNFYKLVYELKMEATGQSAGQAETLKKLRRRKTLEEETDNVPSLDEKGKIKYL